MPGHFPRHPLGHPNCPALRVRCVARSGGDACKLASLRHRKRLSPANPALLARADGDWVRAFRYLYATAKATDTSLRAPNTASALRLAAQKNCSTMLSTALWLATRYHQLRA